jgi:hypothetical protein
MSSLALLSLVAGCSRNELGAVEFEPWEAPESKDPVAFGAWTSFGTSPDGTKLTMSYYDRVQSGVGYAVGTANPDNTFTWIHEPVDGYLGDNGLDTGDRGRYSAQVTLPDGTVWVAYQDTTNRTLRAAHRVGPGAWEESAAIDVAGTGAWASMALDADGRPVVVHCTDDGRVRETRLDGAEWSSRDLYTSSQGQVEHTRLTIQGGKEYVVFRDAGVGHLHLLTDGQDELVDAGGDTGAWPTLLVDGQARWIAYQDLANQDLRIARSEAGGRWETSVVDGGELRGADTAMRLVEGQPEVLYFDGFDNDLRVARRDGDAWATSRVAGEGVAAGFHNRVVTFGGNPYWFSYDYTHDTLLSGRL